MSKCKISSVSCVYHACMSDDCQYNEVKSQNVNLGSRECQTLAHQFADECLRLSEIGIICFVAYNNELGLWRPMVYRKPRPNEVNPKNPPKEWYQIFEPSFQGYQSRSSAECFTVAVCPALLQGTKIQNVL